MNTLSNDMFYRMQGITSLDLSHFDTSNVTAMGWMFWDMLNVEKIYVSNKWSTDSVIEYGSLFSGCVNLVGGSGTVYSLYNTALEYARVDDPANGKPGYFTLKTS